MAVNKKIIIYLIGKPGVGKYTIACELAKKGFVVCDNQLANNPIFALLQCDGFSKIPNFAWDAIKKIRDAIFDCIRLEQNNNYVLTNVLNEDEGDRQLYEQVKEIAEHKKALFIPVKLNISQDAHLKRIKNPSRKDRYKSTDPNDVYDKIPLLTISDVNLLEMDISELSAEAVAKKILNYLEEQSTFV